MKNTLSADLYTGPTGEIFAKYDQCDQMTKLFFQYLAIIMAMKMRPKNTNCAEWAENFAQNQINLKYISNDF